MDDDLLIRPLRDASDAEAFRRLNEIWITEHFALEEQDRQTLGDPFGTVVAHGGQVYVAALGDQVVGTAALVRHAAGVYQLAKMTVATEARQRGVGRQLLAVVLAEARAMGAHRIFLGSSTKLEAAVRLYESFGFVHVPREAIPELQYARASVFMALTF